MNYSRELKATDYFDYARLIEAAIEAKNPKTLGYSRPTSLELSNYYFNDEDALHKVYGTFDDTNILLSCVFLEYSSVSRYWRLACAAKQPFINLSALVETVDHALVQSELANYYHGYACFFTRLDKRWERWLTRKSKVFSRYFISTEEYIPANKRSSFSLYWLNFQLGIISTRPMYIKEYSLPEKFREFQEE